MIDVLRTGQITGGLTVFAILAALGCTKPNEYLPPPPPEVSVAKPATQEISDYLEFTGTTRATAVVEVRARVGGYLQSIHFEDGAAVEKGDLLFVIEPRPFEVALSSAKAALQKAKASRGLAIATLQRTEPLAKRQAVSVEELDIARANVATAEADVASAEAMVDKAELDLSYTKVLAPISGRIGRRMVDIGNLVVPQTNVLTSLESYTPIFAYFTVSESDVLRLIERRSQSTDSGKTEQPRKLWLGLSDHGDYPYKGELDFAEVGVDASTGTQLRRGVFPNEDGRLVPGLFVRLRLPIGDAEPRLLVQERAIAADQRGEYVLVVNAEHKVEYRPVTLGMRVAGARVIEKGVEPGEWVIVNGLQRARPGAPVSPVHPDGRAIEEPVAAQEGSNTDDVQTVSAQSAEAPAGKTGG